jgi:hypothetical protein
MSGMTGVEAAMEMKRLKPDVPINLVSGHSEQPEGTEYADAFFLRGTGTENFLALVSRLTTTSHGLVNRGTPMLGFKTFSSAANLSRPLELVRVGGFSAKMRA